MTEEQLRNRNWRNYHHSILRNGFIRIITNPWKLLLFPVFLITLCAVYPSISLMQEHVLLVTLNIVGFCAYVMLLFLGYIYINGYERKAYCYYQNFMRAGFSNGAGEAPLLIESEKHGNTYILDFRTIGLPAKEWIARKEILETAMDSYIVDVRAKRGNLAEVLVITVPSSSDLPDLVPWDSRYLYLSDNATYYLGRSLEGDVSVDIDKQPHMLIGGSTGSGKSRLTYSICYQALAKGEDVLIYDGKGLDFMPLHNSYGNGAKVIDNPDTLAAELEKCVANMRERLLFFRDIGVRSYPEYMAKTQYPMLHRQWIVIDECAGLLDPTGRTKDEKEKIAHMTSLLAEIAQKGRAVGYHLLVSTQRPDANAVPGVLKSNIDLRICGKADTTLSTIILGDGRADDIIPKYTQGRFVMADGAKDIIFQAFWLEA